MSVYQRCYPSGFNMDINVFVKVYVIFAIKSVVILVYNMFYIESHPETIKPLYYKSNK